MMELNIFINGIHRFRFGFTCLFRHNRKSSGLSSHLEIVLTLKEHFISYCLSLYGDMH